jgi:hypothetical protein
VLGEMVCDIGTGGCANGSLLVVVVSLRQMKLGKRNNRKMKKNK